MLNSSLRLGLVALLALGGAAVAASANAPTADGPFGCGVNKVTDHGMLAIEGVLQSPTALSGEYRFSLKSSGGGGSSNISQGGPFSAAAGDKVSLGKVMVNAGSHVDIDFTISTGGKTFDCDQEMTTRT